MLAWSISHYGLVNQNPFLYHNILLCLVMAKSVPIRVGPFLPGSFGPPAHFGSQFGPPGPVLLDKSGPISSILVLGGTDFEGQL